MQTKLRCLILAKKTELFSKVITVLRGCPNVVICGADRSLQSGAFLTSLLQPDVVLIEDRFIKALNLAVKTSNDTLFIAISRNGNQVVFKALGTANSTWIHNLSCLLDENFPTYRYNKLNTFLSLRSRDGIHIFTVSKIDWIEAVGKSVRVHFVEYSMEFPMRIGAFLQNIKEDCLLRIERSIALNLNNIECISRNNHKAKVKTFYGNEIVFGRRGYARLIAAVQESIGLVGTHS